MHQVTPICCQVLKNIIHFSSPVSFYKASKDKEHKRAEIQAWSLEKTGAIMGDSDSHACTANPMSEEPEILPSYSMVIILRISRRKC